MNRANLTRFSRKWFVRTAIGLIAYVLSAGPVFGFYAAFSLVTRPPWLIAMYQPLWWIAKHTGLEFPLVLYVALWETCVFRGH